MGKRQAVSHPSVEPVMARRRSRFSKWYSVAYVAKRSLTYAAAVILTFVGLYGLVLVSAEAFLVERDLPVNADIIVVLGGDARPRAGQAAALWREGKAPAVLATGYGDCDFARQTLIAAGVDPQAVITECRSQTTWDNAAFSQPILADRGVSRAILVTSWFHSKRAVKRFRSFMPGIQWISVPAERSKSFWEIAGDADGPQVVKEYAKSIFYDLRTSVSGPGPTLPRGIAMKTSRLP
ncbi:YdcF family protein [Neorhizobium alkalisoli]|jgi:uncharacterized SAM-binding protein YcdF (DUF218 family)|nr:YdcF family protein [Neorhizobium alkalisoli]